MPAWCVCKRFLMQMVHLSFQAARLLFANRRQIVNKIVIQQFAGQTEESCNNGL